MRKRNILKELKSHAIILPLFGTTLGLLYAVMDNKNISDGVKKGLKKGTDPVYDLLREYISTSEYYFTQKNGNAKLKIINKKYLMESLSDKVKSDRYILTSLKHINDGLEVSLQFADTKIIKIELEKKDEIYVPINAMYGDYTIYSRA